MPASKCAKIGYLVVLSFQNVLHTLAMRYSRAEYRIRYSVSSVVILSEIVKFSISSLVLFHEGLFKRALSGIYYDTYDFLRTCVPALIYVVQNNIIIFALSCLDATVFQVTYQLKLLTTTIFSVLFLRKNISFIQWISQVVLFIGVAVVQLQDRTVQSPLTSRDASDAAGLIAVLSASVLSGFAAVYFEKILKHSPKSLWTRNFELSLASIAIALVGQAIGEGERVSKKGFFYGFDWLVWATVALQSVGGILVALVVKHADNILKEDVKVKGRGYGKTFFFRINGEALFVRGSNWIPARLFAGGGVEAAVVEAHLLQSAARAGVQMLRVWGGGRYEARRFYDLASHLGIMLWHDMMFACAMYKKPPNGEVDSVETEVRQQVQRLHHHPAIVVWATNNEVEVAAAQHWYGPKSNKQEYRRRFLDSIAIIAMQSETPPVRGTGYIPRRVLLSSPSNADSSTDPYGIDSNPQDPLAGDVHFYSYHDDLWDECTYPVTRFTSEYGIVSLPGPLAWFRSLDSSSSRPDDWMIRGQLMMHRLHKSDGIGILQRLIRDKFGEPKLGRTKEETYTIWAYLTQLYQAIAYKTHINLLERHQCKIYTDAPKDSCGGIWTGQGRSMGHLYWQLNDVWAAPTWSTIDAAGQWKIAHYLAIRGTAPITHPIGRVVVSRVGDRVLINWVPPINPVADDRIRLSVVCSPIHSFTPQPNVLFQSADNLGPWKPNGCPLDVTNFTLKWLLSRCPWGVLTTIIENAVEKTKDTVLLLTPKEMVHQWPVTAGSVSVTSVRRVNACSPEGQSPPFRWDQAFEVQLRAKSPEIFVWLVIDPYINLDGWLSNNAFNMLTCSECTLCYYKKGRIPIDEKRLRKAIRIYTLASVTSDRPAYNQSDVNPR